jgi:hypothetical protein
MPDNELKTSEKNSKCELCEEGVHPQMAQMNLARQSRNQNNKNLVRIIKVRMIFTQT